MCEIVVWVLILNVSYMSLKIGLGEKISEILDQNLENKKVKSNFFGVPLSLFYMLNLTDDHSANCYANFMLQLKVLTGRHRMYALKL